MNFILKRLTIQSYGNMIEGTIPKLITESEGNLISEKEIFN